MPETVLIPAREEILVWGTEDELFAHALGQARAERGIELKRLDLDGAPVSLVSGESFFTATHALWADEFDPPTSEHGTLLVVPRLAREHHRLLGQRRPPTPTRVLAHHRPRTRATHRHYRTDSSPESAHPGA